jgi:hypothetical protein
MSRPYAATGYLAILVAAGVVVSATAGTAAVRAVSTPLVGTWAKTVKESTWAKHGITYEKAGHWVMTFSKNGVLTLFQPPGSQADLVTHMSAATAGPALVVGPTADGFCPDKAAYTWKVSGEHLVIGGGTEDSCDARTILFASGAWTRK